MISISAAAANDQMTIIVYGIPSEHNGKVGMLILDTGGSGSDTITAWSMPTAITDSVSTNQMLDWVTDRPFSKDGTYMVVLDISESSARGAPTLYNGAIRSKRITGKEILITFSEFEGTTAAAAPTPAVAAPPASDPAIVAPAPVNMVRLDGNTFMMGSPASEPGRNDNENQHRVTLTRSYLIGKYPVTQKEWVEIMGSNPSHFKGGDNLPVEMVSWFDAVEYCNKLSQKEGLTPVYTISGRNVSADWNANGYRLPTEVEWEFAARAGTNTPFSTGMNITTDHANYDGRQPYNNNPAGVNRASTTPVGSFAPNALGLYDMHGNVVEWIWDWYSDYLPDGQIDPTGPASGSFRVLRGGAWSYSANGVRSAARQYNGPSLRHNSIGFRVVRNYVPGSRTVQ